MARQSVTQDQVKTAILAITKKTSLKAIPEGAWPGIQAIREYTKAKFPIAGNPSTLEKHRRALQAQAQREREKGTLKGKFPLPDTITQQLMASAETLWMELIRALEQLEHELEETSEQQIKEAERQRDLALEALDALQSQHQTQGKTLAKTQNELQRSKDSLAQVTQDLTAARTRSQGLEALVDELRTTSHALTEKVSRLEQSVQDQHSDNAKKLDDLRQNHQRDQEALRQRLTTQHESGMASLRKDMHTQSQQHSKERQDNAIQQQRLQDQVAQLNQALESEKTSGAKTLQKLESVMSEKARLENELATNKGAVEQVNRQLAQLEQAHAALLRENKELLTSAGRVPDLEKQVQKLEKMLNR